MSSIVVDFRSREQWLTAFRAVALARNYTKTEILLAVSLAQAFYCKTGMCDPGYPRLVKETGACERSLKEAAKKLEADGWCSRKRGGRDDNVNFTLKIPTGISADKTALMNGAPYVQKSASISADTPAPLITEVVTEKSAAPAARTSRMDRPVYTRENTSISSMSAPDGALDCLIDEWNPDPYIPPHMRNQRPQHANPETTCRTS